MPAKPEASPAAGGADLWIANTVTDLIQGDVQEHLPLQAIALQGDVLGLGTTTSIDNGELTFLRNADGNTTIWKCQASDGGIRALRPADGSAHFPYVCFSGDASALRVSLDPAELGPCSGQRLQPLLGAAIDRLRQQGRLAQAPIYGVRLELEWRSLVITVASKLCMGQRRRNSAIATEDDAGGGPPPSLYDSLQHFRFAAADPANPADPIRYLGASLRWDCCGFFDTDPSSGRVTVPQADAHLHLHGCSTDLRHGGHLHHEHPGSCLGAVVRCGIYPLRRLHGLASDLAVEGLHHDGEALHFRVLNRGAMDVSSVGVVVVINDRYSDHRYLRLPWLAAGAAEAFTLPLPLPAGEHRLVVIADPERHILEEARLLTNNRATLTLKRP